VVAQERYLSRNALNFEGDDLRYFEIEADPAGAAIGELDCEVLMEGAGGYEEEIDAHAANALPTLLRDAHLQHVRPQLVLRHLKVKFIVDLPLASIEHTFIESSLLAQRGSSENCSCWRRKDGTARF
jgi:hypothetical protein